MGDLVFVGSCSGNFYALDRKNGEVRWSYNIKQDGDQTSFHGDPLIAGDLIIVGTDVGKQGHIYAFEWATGRVRWKYQVKTGANGDYGVSSDIVRKGNEIFATAQGDDLLCLDLDTGRVRWHFSSGFDRSKFAWADSPAIKGGIVFFAGHDGVVYALDAHSGKLIWKHDLQSPVTTSPLTFGNSVYAGTADGHFHRLRAKDGASLGSIEIPGEPWRNVTLAGNELLTTISSGPDALVSVDLASLRIRWSVKPLDPDSGWSTAWPYMWQGKVLVGDKGHLYAYRLSNGSLAWSHAFPGHTPRGIGVTPKVLYVGTIHGMVYAFAPPR